MSPLTERIDPVQAEKLLTQLAPTLTISKRAAKSLADIVSHDRWTPTHQGVVVDSKDRVISGAEILSAICTTGKTIEVKITRDVRTESIFKYNRGKPRTSKDILKAALKTKNAGVEAPILTALIVHALELSSTSPLVVEHAHKHFKSAVDEVIAIKESAGSTAFWGNPAKAVIVLSLAGEGYREKTRQFVSELFDRRPATPVVIAYRRKLNLDYHTLTTRERFNRALIALAAYCGLESENPITLKNEFLQRSEYRPFNTMEAAS